MEKINFLIKLTFHLYSGNVLRSRRAINKNLEKNTKICQIWPAFHCMLPYYYIFDDIHCDLNYHPIPIYIEI